jgi:hypothetical protein
MLSERRRKQREKVRPARETERERAVVERIAA